MASPSVADELRAGHAWLVETGFCITEERLEEAFGDSYAVLEGHGVLLRVIRDRGQYWTEIALRSPPEGWMLFSDACAVLFGPPPPSPLTLEAAMAQVKDKLLAVAPRVRDDGPALQARVRELARARTRAWEQR